MEIGALLTDVLYKRGSVNRVLVLTFTQTRKKR